VFLLPHQVHGVVMSHITWNLVEHDALHAVGPEP
jgi:hypothetical protein